MMPRNTLSSSLFSLILATLALIPLISAQTCNATSLCPSTAPCCSEYGYCGSGTYCLGGCAPLYSHTLTSCRPDPLCVSASTDFTDLSRVQQNSTVYNGNATAYDWVVNSGSLISDPNGQGARLLLTDTNGGTKISSTRYVHYGTIDFVLETSKWAGVVTAAITMSDVKDEIDWEWPGNSTSSAQTNYWFMGIANYSATEGQGISVDSDTSSNFHTYTFDWQEDYLNWSIDGNVVRTVLKSDTISSDGSKYQYPSTPSRIQISIWPAGISSSAQGTIDWSGGLIDWSDEDYTSNGYFWNTIQSVNVTCAAVTNQTSGTTGWAYTGNDTTGVPIVAATNASILLSSAHHSISVSTTCSSLTFIFGLMGLLAGIALF